MNRVAGRAMIAMVLVIALFGGMVFFAVDYVSNSGSWVRFSGSPHYYQNSAMILDSDGAVLVDFSGGKTYAADAALRKATMHWLGDRTGNVDTTIYDAYRKYTVLYDMVGGVYTYGDAEGRIQLTLSSRLETAALKAMGDRKGTVAVYNYRTGEIVCAVSTPTFDPDNMPDIAGDTTGAYEGVYMNRFLQNTYTPGSIFKIVTLAVALECIPDARELTFDCDGAYEIGSGKVTCESSHGHQTLKQAFANSCNCAFAQLVQKIGRDKLQQYVELFGITDSVSFDGFVSKKGNFDLSDAYNENLCWSGIGQYTDLINPCAYLRFVGAIAAGGAGYAPYVVEKVTVGKQTTYEAKAQREDRIMSQETAATIREYMRNNVAAKYGDENFQGFTVCAKTGTAQVKGKKPNAMFTGFLLDEEYPYAFIVAVEDAGYGRTVCVPIVSAILKELKQS
ncbi:MAG: penicillin-binding transpeptidase domain-containing protein [Faecousia sp.]